MRWFTYAVTAASIIGSLPRLFFFFTQKTAYEMRISDWSSDVCSSDLSLTADCEIGEWQRVIDINLGGVFNCMKHELPAMKAAGGVIVNTASIMGLVGSVGGAAYCASKHGVIG